MANGPQEAQICSPVRRPSCNILMPFDVVTVSRPNRLRRLLAEVVGTVRWQVWEGIGRLAAVSILEVDVRPGRVAGRSLVADQLTLTHTVAGLDLEAQQVAGGGEEVVAVGNDDVVAVADQLAVEQAGTGRHHDAVIGGQDRGALTVSDIDPGVEVRIAKPGRFERLTAGAEDKREAALLQRPDE